MDHWASQVWWARHVLSLFASEVLGLRAFLLGVSAMDAAKPLAEQDSGADDGSKDDSLKGLADLRDNIPEVRQRLRKKFNLLVHYDPKLQKMFNVKVEKSTHNVRLNAPVLSPVLKIMKLTNDLPAIDRLMEQVVDVFGRFSLPITESLSNSQSWAIRGMIQVLKKNKNKKAWQQDNGCAKLHSRNCTMCLSLATGPCNPAASLGDGCVSGRGGVLLGLSFSWLAKKQPAGT